MDLHDALHDLQRTLHEDAPDLVHGPIAAAARRRRALVRSGYAAVSTLAVTGLVVGGLTLADRRPPLPPAVTTWSPAPLPTVSESTAPPPADVPWSPNLSRCGLSGSTWVETMATQASPVSVVNYWGPDAVASVDGWTSISDAIWTDDLGGASMSVEVLDAVVMTQGYGTDGVQVVGDVRAVLGAPVDPFQTPITSGSEGGGGGSSGSIETTLPLALCDGATTLPDGVYLTVTRYRLTVDGGRSAVVLGASYQQLGEAPATPDETLPPSQWTDFESGAESAFVWPEFDPVLDPQACGGVQTAQHEAVLDTTGPFWSVPPAQFVRVPSGTTTLSWRSQAGSIAAAPARYGIVTGSLSAFVPGQTTFEGHGVNGSLGEVTALLDAAPIGPLSEPASWTGVMEVPLQFDQCGAPAGARPIPDGLWVVHMKVQMMMGTTVGSFWTEELVAVGDVALP